MVKGLCGEDETPGSGLYLDDLPDMGRWKLESVSSPSWTDFSKVWDKVYRRAIRNMQQDIRASLPKKIKASNVLANVVAGDYYHEFEAVGPGTGNYKGLFVRVQGSQYLDLYLNQVQVYLAAAGNVPVKVFDAQTGEELYSKTFSGGEGHNAFQVNRNFTTTGQWREFFICYDDTGITSYRSSDDFPSYSQNYDWYMITQGGSVAKTSQVIESNISKSGRTGGLIANFNLLCSMEAFMCQHREPLKNALLYKCGVEVCREIYESDEVISRYSLLSSEDAAARIEHFESEYVRALEAVLKVVDPVIDEVCFHCDPAIQWKVNLP